MFKIYKRTLHIGTPEDLQKLDSNEYRVSEVLSTRSKSNILTIPAMIAGAVVGTLVFSVFLVLLLIPLGIVGFKAWRLMQKAQQQTDDQTITAEYTVLSKKDK